MYEMRVTGVYPVEAEIKRFIDKHKAVLNEKKKKRRTIEEIHNAYTDYILALLMCSVGHRAVEDPFGTYDCFDLESGLVLLSDKVVLESRAWRLAALPKIACEQIAEYLNYLNCLSQKLHQNGMRKLASAVAHITHGKKFPFLFYLNKNSSSGIEVITPQQMKIRWSEFWHMPVNFTRHITAQLTINGRCSVEEAQIQLGHITSIYHTFGKTSDKTPITTLAKIGACINEQLITLGFAVINSPIRKTSSAIKFVKADISLKYSPGYEKRTKSRRRKRELIIKTVTEVLKTINFSFEATADNDALTEVLVTSVVKAASKHGASENYCLKVLYKYLFRRIKDKKKIRQLRAIEPEKSPFTKQSLVQYRKAKMARKQFLEYLREQAIRGGEITAAARKSEIRISSILFGGITNDVWLKGIDESLDKHCYQLDGQIFIDFPIHKNADKSMVFRWYPDPVTKHLIIGYYKDRSLLKQGIKITTAKAIEEMLNCKTRIFESKIDLHDAIKNASRIERPGYIASVTSGEIVSASLPLSSYMRSISNKSLSDDRTSDRVQDFVTQATWLPKVESILDDSGNDQKKSFRLLWREFTREIRETSLSGNEDANDQRKRMLSSKLKEHFSVITCHDNFTLLLVSWAVNLCEKGTRYKSAIAYSTVIDYVGMIKNALRSELSGINIISSDDDVLLQAYLIAIENAKAGSKNKLAGRIDEFHDFIYSNFGVAEVDLTEIYAAAGLSPGTRIDANVVTESEYLDILDWIASDKSMDRQKRCRAVSCMILGYRIGLRFGEIYKLLVRDIQYDGNNELVVVVDDNQFDGTKSEQGKRVAYLTEDLCELEKNIIKESLAYTESNFSKDSLAAFLSLPELPRQRTPKSELARYISYMLKLSTGDDGIRFHHLRHSFATRLYSHFFCGQKTSSHSSYYKHDTHNADCIQAVLGSTVHYPLATIRTLLGHSGSQTTISSYVHTVNMVLEQHYNDFDGLLCDYAMSYAERSSYATVRSMRRRKSRRRYKNIPTPNIRLRKRVKPKPYTNFSDLFSVTPGTIDTILTLSSSRHISYEAIAERVALNVNDVKEIIHLGIELERTSGFTRYALTNLDTNHFPVIDLVSNLVPTLYDSETNAIHHYFRDNNFIDYLRSNGDDVSLCLNSWARTYHQYRQTNVITSTTDLNHIISLTSILGIASNPVVYAEDLNNVSDDIKHFCTANKIPIHRKPIPSAHEKLHIIRSARVELLINVNDKIITTRRAFHRILFLVDLFVGNL